MGSICTCNDSLAVTVAGSGAQWGWVLQVQKFPGEARAGQGPREQIPLPPTAIPEGLHGHPGRPAVISSGDSAAAPSLHVGPSAGPGTLRGASAWGGASACTCSTDGDSRGNRTSHTTRLPEPLLASPDNH